VEAYIGIGSNIEPEENILDAVGMLRSWSTRGMDVSPFYWTPPLHCPEQPPFLNGACRIETDVPPRDLKFRVLRSFETALGRIRTADRNAPRTIDLDILVYGDLVLDEPDLKIPDPDILDRPFLKVPLADLAPHLVIPGLDLPLSSLLVSGAMVGMREAPGFSRRVRQQVASPP